MSIKLPQLALPPTSTSPIWHFPQLALFAIFFEKLSPPTAGTPDVFTLLSLEVCKRYNTRNYGQSLN